jgi:hypothetical protein
MEKQANELQHAAACRRGDSKARRARLSVLVVMLIVAAGVMAAESWVLRHTPTTAFACELAQASDFTRAFDATIAARTTKVLDQRAN